MGGASEAATESTGEESFILCHKPRRDGKPCTKQKPWRDRRTKKLTGFKTVDKTYGLIWHYDNPPHRDPDEPAKIFTEPTQQREGDE